MQQHDCLELLRSSRSLHQGYAYEYCGLCGRMFYINEELSDPAYGQSSDPYENQGLVPMDLNHFRIIGEARIQTEKTVWK